MLSSKFRFSVGLFGMIGLLTTVSCSTMSRSTTPVSVTKNAVSPQNSIHVSQIPTGIVFNIMDYGATGNKENLVTPAIQAAIDAAFAQGGGQVHIPAGDHLIGTIELKSNVTLYLETGATLWASQNEKDFREIPYNTIYDKIPVLIYATGVVNVAIRGKGKIHGQARRELKDFKKPRNFNRMLDGDEVRNAFESGIDMQRYSKIPPYVTLALFSKSKNITLEDVTFLESNFWTLHIYRSENVVIRGIQVYSDMTSGVNADGIGIDSSRDVTVSDVIIRVGDDGIVLKTSYDEEGFFPTENILVNNCNISSSSAGLKIGTETFSDFRNIHFSNCILHNTNRGLNIVMRDGGLIENVTFTNITIEANRKDWFWWGNGDPIWVVILKRNGNSKLGSIRNVVFDNIIARGQGTSRLEGFAPNKDHPEGRYLENIQLRDVKIQMEPEGKEDKRATHGLQASYVNRLRLENIDINWNPDVVELEWSSALDLLEVDRLTLRGFVGRQGVVRSLLPVIQARNLTNSTIEDVEGHEGAGVLLHFSGYKTSNVLFDRVNRMRLANRTVRVEMDVPVGGVQ